MFGDLITVSNINFENDTVMAESNDSAEQTGTETIIRNTHNSAAGSNGSDIYMRARAIYYRARRNNASRAVSIF